MKPVDKSKRSNRRCCKDFCWREDKQYLEEGDRND